MLEQEQGYLKTDRWYYDYTESEFINLTMKYPYIPFFVEDGTSKRNYYRWNTENGRLESVEATQIFFGKWKPAKIEIKSNLSRKTCLTFIVYTDALASSICNKREGIEIIINNVHQELEPKKLRVIRDTPYNENINRSQCM